MLALYNVLISGREKYTTKMVLSRPINVRINSIWKATGCGEEKAQNLFSYYKQIALLWETKYLMVEIIQIDIDCKYLEIRIFN